MSLIHKNKIAFHDYEIIKTFEAGIELEGWEVKSIKGGNVNLKESYIDGDGRDLVIFGMHVSKWKQGDTRFVMNETRKRKLLVSRREIDFLLGRKQQKGLTIIPLDVHLERGYIKMSIALARGTKEYEKREKLKNRDIERSMRKELV